MKKSVLLAMLTTLMLLSLSVEAHQRNSDKHWKHGNHHSYKHDHGRHHKHGKHMRHVKRGHAASYDVRPHHRYSSGHRSWHRDDGGPWGIVFRYFE